LISGKECGKVENGTSNGKWYTVKCQGAILGDSVELKTTRNDYLSISGIEIWSGAGTVTTTTTTTTTGIPIKVQLSGAKLSTTYSSTYSADKALTGGKNTAISKNGVGQWWRASFGSS
jgi:hypothetical protein